MNSLLYYYNNVQKMAAYRQAKRMQGGSKLGYGDIATSFYSAGISLGVSDFSIEYWGNAYGSGNGATSVLFNRAAFGSSSNPAYFQVYGTKLGQNNLNWVAFGIPSGGDITTDSLNFSYSAPTIDAKFHLVITREGKTIRVYIDNVLIASKEQSEIKDFGDLQLAIANSSDVGFVRVWNYALSADDVTDHYNNGDPMGYVVPKAMRMPHIEFPTSGHTESNGVFRPNSISDTTLTTDIPQANGFSGNYMRFDAVTTVSLYCAYYLLYLRRTPPIKITMEYRSNHDIYEGITAGNPGMMLASANEGDAKVIEVHYPSSIGQAYLGIAGNDPNAWLEIRVLSIEPVGLIAEYLPQNLMCGRDDKSIATSWLDSAKQLPLSDEYMEPLFQSIGGYDMAANGAPEILYYGPEQVSKGVTLSLSPQKP